MPPKRRQEESSEDEGAMGPMGVNDNIQKFMNVNFSREFMVKLHPDVRKRAEGVLGVEASVKARVDASNAAKRALERKYAAVFQPLFDRRREIVTGTGAPVSEEEVKAGVPEDHIGKVDFAAVADETKGVEDFWLNALQHHVIIEEMITERDMAVLKHLSDISVVPNEESEGSGFTLKFTFEPNEFFSNDVLTKQFILREEDGEHIITETKETAINWKSEDKNVTVETVTKKVPSKGKGAAKFKTTTEPCDSFFRLFDKAEEDEEAEQWYSLADTLKSKIIPLAAEYFTGEAPDGNSDIDEDDYDEEDEEDDEDDESEEEEPAPRGAAGRGRGGPAPKPGGKQDCKQQ